MARLALGASRYTRLTDRGVLLEVGDGRMLELVSAGDGSDELNDGGRCQLIFVVDDIEVWRDRVGRLGQMPVSSRDGATDTIDIEGPDGVTVTISEARGLQTSHAGRVL